MSDHLSSNLAHNLRRLRERRRLSQEALSRLSGVPRPTLAHLESGAANPTLGVVLKVMNALNVSLDALVGSPRGELLYYPENRQRRRGGRGVKLYQFTHSLGELCLSRVEMAPNARWSPDESDESSCHHLVCEKGTLSVAAGGQAHALNAMDLVVARSDDGFKVTNADDATSVLYALRSPQIATE